MANKLYEENSVKAIADAIREKTGGTATYKVGDMATAVAGLPTKEAIAHADIPDYVKAAALEVAKKFRRCKHPAALRLSP